LIDTTGTYLTGSTSDSGRVFFSKYIFLEEFKTYYLFDFEQATVGFFLQLLSGIVTCKFVLQSLGIKKNETL